MEAVRKDCDRALSLVRRCYLGGAAGRVQTLPRQADPDVHRLLSACKSRFGVGMLLNMSLNRRGEPIIDGDAA